MGTICRLGDLSAGCTQLSAQDLPSAMGRLCGSLSLDSHSPEHRIRSKGRRNLGCAQNCGANTWKIVQSLLKRERAHLQLPEYLVPLLFPPCFTASINPALYKTDTFLKVNFRAVTPPYSHSHPVAESGSGGKR